MLCVRLDIMHLQHTTHLVIKEALRSTLLITISLPFNLRIGTPKQSRNRRYFGDSLLNWTRIDLIAAFELHFVPCEIAAIERGSATIQ